MQIIREIAALKRHLRPLQNDGLRIGLVPTMGALHAGHVSLVKLARTKADVVVASVFVNPTQFGPNEDFTRYPRDLEGDAAKLAEGGCHLLFAPDVSEMYPAGFQTEVKVTEVSRGLCGDQRPGHFQGVATVVLKLWNVVRPDLSVFGEKDFQQLAVLRTLAKDLSLDVEVVGAPLIREADGLAMSSRNMYLSADDRAKALGLSRGLFAARDQYEGGERAAAKLLAAAKAELDGVGVVPEYLELRAFDGLRPLETADVPSVMLVAARVGTTRLIDNLILRRP